MTNLKRAKIPSVIQMPANLITSFSDGINQKKLLFAVEIGILQIPMNVMIIKTEMSWPLLSIHYLFEDDLII